MAKTDALVTLAKSYVLAEEPEHAALVELHVAAGIQAAERVSGRVLMQRTVREFVNVGAGGQIDPRHTPTGDVRILAHWGNGTSEDLQVQTQGSQRFVNPCYSHRTVELIYSTGFCSRDELCEKAPDIVQGILRYVGDCFEHRGDEMGTPEAAERHFHRFMEIGA